MSGQAAVGANVLAQSPELLAAYLGAMDLDFYVDAECAPELAAAAETLAARYAAATRTPA